MNDDATLVITDTDIHEAGHAVASACLRVPFYRVYASNIPNDMGACVLPTKVRFTWIPRIAVICLASRAAIEQYIRSHKLRWLVDARWFADDEAEVRECASHLDIRDSEFSDWRLAMLNQAYDLVAAPFVQKAIELVARFLAVERTLAQADQTTNKGLPSAEVRRILRYCKEAALAKENCF